MKSKYVLNSILILFVCALPLLFNNCAATHSDGSQNNGSTSGACAEQLMAGYKSSYFPVLTNNCSSCHSSGVLMHGSSNVANSFATFQNKKDNILEYAHGRAPHQTVNAATIAPLAMAAKPIWDTAEALYLTCLSRVGSDETPGNGVPVTVPDKFTTEKTATVPVGQTVTLSWNLGTEMLNSGNNLAGAQIDILVKSLEYGYEFRLPLIKNTGVNALFMRGIAVKVNGVVIPNGTSFYDSQRNVSNVTGKNERLLSSGGGPVLLGNTGLPIKVALGFIELRVSDYPTFNPLNYMELTAAGGVFATSCVSCHNGGATPIAGFGVATANYRNLIGGNGASGNPLVTPFNLEASNIYQRMISDSPGLVMPTAGKLPVASINQVRDWILDGARLNN
jgi:mono/diheme cytochrome c family protein